MDQLPPSIPRKLIHYKGRHEIRGPDDEKVKDEANSNCVTLCKTFNEEAGLLEIRQGAREGMLSAEFDLKGSSDVSSEDVMMDKLFQACDPKGKGKVKVSDLVKYLTTIVDKQLQEGSAVASLIAIMDPKNINAEIGSTAFHHGLHQWIEQMKSGRFIRDMSILSSKECSAAFDVSQTEGMESSIEENTGEDKLSVTQLSSRLTDLQYINRKLSEEIKESRAASDSKEEELSKFSRDLQNAKHEIKRLSELAELRHEAEAENEELREQISTLNKKLEAEKHKTHQTEQEKELLKVQLQRYKSQVDKLKTDLSISQQHLQDLKSQLAKNKDKISQLKVACSGFDARLGEKDEHIQQLQTCLREVNKINEDLKNHNQDIQGQLIDNQQELLSLQSVLDTTSNGTKFPSLREMAREIEEDIEQLKTVHAQEFPSSIHNELQNLLLDSPSLPWPLSQKELKESVVATPDLVSQVGHAVNMGCQSIDEEVDNLDSPRMGSTDTEKDPRLKTKCNCDYHYDVSNDKLRLFVSLLKYFKDENKKLRNIATPSCMCERGVTKPSSESDGKEPVPSSQKKSSFVKDVNEELHRQRQHKTESKKTVQMIQDYNEKLLQEITRLKRSNVTLSEELHKSELHICELEEEFQNTKSNLKSEKQKCTELEESLYSSTLARQLDLHDIWRLVQKDVETECEDFQDDYLQANTHDQLKENIRREIEDLRIQLERKEAVLGSLKNNNLNLHLSLNYDDLYQASNRHHSCKLSTGPSLANAVTIDVFNGNLPMYDTNYQGSPSFVSCEDVDCYDCREARLYLQGRFPASCPSTVPSKVNSYLSQGLEPTVEKKNQTDIKEDHPEDRRRPLEVTKNVCVTNSPKRKRSLFGSYRHQDFINSSGRGVKELQRTFPNQQLESSTTTTQTNNEISAADNNIKTDLHSFSNRNIENHNLCKHQTHVNGDVEPNLGVRRSSFTLAVECNQQESQPCITNELTVKTKNNSSSIEELRRPSFHAAIERGNDPTSVSNSTIKRKVVQIASPEITENNQTTKNDRQKSGKNESSEKSKTVKFCLNETEPDICDEAHTGALACGSLDQRSTADATTTASFVSSSLNSSQSSSLRSTSLYSPTSSYSMGNEQSSSSLPLHSRHSLEKKQEYSDSHILTDKEHSKDGNTSVYAHVRQDIMAAATSHLPVVKEVTCGQNFRDGMVHLTPERYNNTQTAKLSIVRESLPAIKQNIPTTSSTSAVQSSSVSSIASPLPPNSPVLTKSPTKHQGTHDVRRECVQAEITSSTAETQNCGDCAITEVKKSTGKTVISANPPGARCSISSSYLPEPLASTKLSKIRQGHIASKKREQMKARGMKLPELAESSELETRPKLLAPPPSTDLPMTMLQVKPMMDMPQISVTDEDADIPPTPSDDIVTPSLPDSFLGKLGLCIINSSNGDISKDSTDQLAEKDLESKFVSLSLAFKTDKLTLDKRVTIQERSRDLAEQNVDIELQGLRIAVETVSELVTDVQLRDLLQRIKLHMNVLEQLAARVSSSAEVYGAVQQEKRLCKAMEVMVMYTENLRRIREKEESELHEARKVLQEKSGNSLSVDSDSGPNRRSLSVGGYNSATRMSSTKSQQAHLISNTINDAGDFTDSTSVRRRSEIALPRIIGGAGSPPLTTTATMENLPPFVGQTNTNSMSQESEDGEDPKSKFQSAVASTSMQNVISNTIRRCSLEKRSSVSSTSSMSSSFSSGNTPLSTLSVNKESYPSSVSEHRSENMEVKVSKSEDAFRKGFEEGLKAKLSLELDELRDQQHSLSHNLEQMMDKVEQSQLEDEEYFSRPSRLEATLSLASTMGGHMLQYDWMSNKRIIRNLAGVFFVILAIFVVYHFPPLPTVDVKHVTKPPQ